MIMTCVVKRFNEFAGRQHKLRSLTVLEHLLVLQFFPPDDKKNKENDKPPCDTRSPLCYTTFPGKRLGYQETDPPIMTERRQLTDDSKGSALQDAGENQQREDCNPKRDYYCRYRIPGKRDKVR